MPNVAFDATWHWSRFLAGREDQQTGRPLDQAHSRKGNLAVYEYLQASDPFSDPLRSKVLPDYLAIAREKSNCRPLLVDERSGWRCIRLSEGGKKRHAANGGTVHCASCYRSE